jgi:L-asparaginase
VREVTVLAAGGTISSVEGASGEPGATPALDAAALVAALPGALSVEARTLRSVNGPQLTNDDALALARAAVAETERGRGVVLTSGTDTIEEVAVLCDALASPDPAHPPIVVTGAIRPADAPGADGPANILDAIVAAASPHTAGFGGLVCFAGELHAARSVRKVDSTAPQAFASPRSGPIARIAEGAIEVFARPVRGPQLPIPETLELRIPIVTTWLGDDGGLLRAALATGPDGLVLAGLGGGHLPPRTLAALRERREGLPVAFVVRPGRGHLLRSTYGFEGSERDVLATGVIEAAALSAPAARMLLLAALAGGLDGEVLRAVFRVGA